MGISVRSGDACLNLPGSNDTCQAAGPSYCGKELEFNPTEKSMVAIQLGHLHQTSTSSSTLDSDRSDSSSEGRSSWAVQAKAISYVSSRELV